MDYGLIILGIIAVIMVGGIVLTIICAPDGYEAEDGFHFGREPEDFTSHGDVL